MRLILTLLVLVSGFITGFGGVYWMLPRYDASWPAGKIAYLARLDDQLLNFDYGDEWRRLGDGRLWLVQTDGRVLVTLANRPRQDVELALRTLPDAGKPGGESISVAVNGKRLGFLAPVAQGATNAETAIVIPQDLAASARTMTVSFRTASPGGTNGRQFALEELRLGDYQPTPMAGVVDACTRDMVQGWAATDSGGAPVVIRKNGEVIGIVTDHHDRPDLPAHGLPLRAGFAYRFAPPLQPGDKVEFFFPDGKLLREGGCHI